MCVRQVITVTLERRVEETQFPDFLSVQVEHTELPLAGPFPSPPIRDQSEMSHLLSLPGASGVRLILI